ncbi:hypothetical protein [Candidatus Paracaedibacter symbiosus]|uniref:hypothetical protein n=1 Tax=Candidatus Paracaedibacter symbiosus TaxID=244582 RepID=UPI0012EC9730|nr:hypothetical protein [Candidatus Paracaedibacter symbiosus]
MAKAFEQFDLFQASSPGSAVSPSPIVKKNPPPFPNVLLNALMETDARTNAVYYLRIINKSAQKRLFSSSQISDKKIFFAAVLNEIKLKQGRLNPVLCCRDAVLRQTLLLQKK